jgi:FAD/FMN-containing dehydrogenase
MKISDLESVFKALHERFAGLGLVETKTDDYSREFQKPEVFTLEFVSDRYDDDINVLLSGHFSDGNQLVLGILANAVDPDNAKDIRLKDASKNGYRIIAGSLCFLEKHVDSLIDDPDKYLGAYSQAIRDLRNQHGLKTSST